MKPRISILSPDFDYVPAVRTDIARTFARIRREHREQAKQQRFAEATNALIRAVAAKDPAPSPRPSGATSQASAAGVDPASRAHGLRRSSARG